MFGKIIFATTGTPSCDHAAHVAFDLRKKYNSELTLFHSMGVPSRGFSPFVKDSRTGEDEYMDNDYADWIKEELRTYYAKQLSDAPDVLIETSAGESHREILRGP